MTKPGIYKVFATYKYCDTKDSVNVIGCFGLEEIEVGIGAKLYPNPNRDIIQLKIENVKEDISISNLKME